MDEQALLHIARNEDLELASDTGRYRAASLDSEGFLHCCYPSQLAGVTRRWFTGADNLTLLSLDLAMLDSAPVLENTTGGTELFPHLYSELPLAAIITREDFGLASKLRRSLAEDL